MEGKVKVTDFGIARAASSNTINGNAMGSVLTFHRNRQEESTLTKKAIFILLE